MIDESLFSRQPQVITSGTDILSEPSDSEKILRLADRGLSSEEIVSRLGIPLFQVEFILNAQKMST
jgi:hypothetical protein